MSYIKDHPTRFNFAPKVRKAVNRVQRQVPKQTYANTYVWHPPYDPPAITRRYDTLSVDFWGGGVVNGRYAGYRGKPLPPELGDKIFRMLWNGSLPIHWIIWKGKMWIRGVGWSAAPGGPADSDAGHYKHLHCTFLG